MGKSMILVLSEKSEKALPLVKKIALLNDHDLTNKTKIVNYGLEMIAEILEDYFEDPEKSKRVNNLINKK